MSAGSGRHTGAAVGAVDLSKRKALSADEVAEAQKQAELEAGMRCRGCGRRIFMGLELVVVRLKTDDGPQRMQVMRTYACVRDDCDFGPSQVKKATAYRMIEWAWPGEPEPEPAPVASSE